MNLPAFPMGCRALPGFSLKSLNLPYLLCTSKSTLLYDLYLQGQTYEECVQNVIDTTVLSDNLGLVVHPEKTIFIPTQVLTTLGFVINSVTMTIQMTREKASGLERACSELLACSSPTIREVARVVAKIFCSFLRVMHRQTSLLRTLRKR